MTHDRITSPDATPAAPTAPPRDVLDFYTRPSMMTSAGDGASQLAALPTGLADLTGVIHGLLLHEHWAPAYGVTLSDERRAGSHIRRADEMLKRLFAADGQPLTTARSLDTRLVGTCRNFSVLLVAILRAQGVPARARCGFGGYFGTGRFEDHWVGEYWNPHQARWMLVDAQIDEFQAGKIQPDFDLCDVPRDRFVIAGDAWARCRAGEADPASFGLSGINESGLWFIAGNVLRDVAALNNVEMLPWDVWGAMPAPNEAIGPDQRALFDRLAALTHDPDAHFAELRACFQQDERLRVPTTVYNAVRNRDETV
jgi:hypothetical protein